MTIGIHSQRISILYLIVGHSFVKFEPFRDILILQYLFFRFQLYRTYHTENREIVIFVEIWFEQSRQLWICICWRRWLYFITHKEENSLNKLSLDTYASKKVV